MREFGFGNYQLSWHTFSKTVCFSNFPFLIVCDFQLVLNYKLPSKAIKDFLRVLHWTTTFHLFLHWKRAYIYVINNCKHSSHLPIDLLRAIGLNAVFTEIHQNTLISHHTQSSDRALKFVSLTRPVSQSLSADGDVCRKFIDHIYRAIKSKQLRSADPIIACIPQTNTHL